MRYASVCSGIEGASVAWEPLGWEPIFLSEVEPFARAVLKERFPHVPLHGDFQTIRHGEYGTADLVIAGTPCQDFSVAGLRAGLTGARGQLTLEFCRLLGRLRPRWLVWENVPGVLSADEGRAFGTFLGLLGELGYGFAYRILDAQFFGVPQRRRRVFVVGYSGDWRAAAAVLFEPDSLSGHPTPSRNGWACGSGAAGNGTASGSSAVTPSLTSSGAGVSRVKGAQRSDDLEWFSAMAEAHADRIVGFDIQGDTQGAVLDIAPTLRARDCESKPGGSLGIAFYPNMGRNARTQGITEGVAGTINAGAGAGGNGQAVVDPSFAARRLTPRECERLQGFPDDWTLIPWRKKMAADGPRYRALGNAFAVPVIRWLGQRIELVEQLLS